MKKAELEKELTKLQDKVYCLQARHDFLLKEMCQQAEGIGVKPPWFVEGSTSWDSAMKHKASLAVDKVAKTRLL
jgi:hypothetical protein